MTTQTNIEIGRAPSALTSEDLRRHLLALVLAAVLVWYTALAVPAHAPAQRRAARTPEDGGRDGEVRGRVGLEPKAGSSAGISITESDSDKSVEELDWPEYIFVE